MNTIIGISGVAGAGKDTFFNLLSESQKIPIMTSVWGPQILLILISSISLIKINEK